MRKILCPVLGFVDIIGQMLEPDDHQLLAEFARDQSEDAFAALAARYINLVYSTAFRCTSNPHYAEEISQAVFVILARKAGTISPRVVLSGWLYQATRLTAANFMKGEIRRQRREQEVYMQSTLKEPNDAAWNEMAPLLDEAMGNLGQTDRDTIVLRFFQNKSSAEIGAALRMTEETARRRVNRALDKLRHYFSKRGVHSTTAIIAGAISNNSVQAAPVGLAKTISAMAVTKGIAASTSTLTLIKGAMKVMAWSKTKTTVVGVAIALLGIGTTAFVVNALLPVPDIQGTWEGMINITAAPGLGIHRGETPKDTLVLRIAKVDGAYRMNVDDIGQAAQEQLALFTYKYPNVYGESTVSDRSFVAKIDRSGEKMTGKILQLPAKTVIATVAFTRTNNPTPFPEPLTDDEFAPRTGSDLQGFWVGQVGRGRGAIPIQIKIAESSDGTFRADYYNLKNAGTNRFPMTVSYDGTTVKLMLMNGMGMFEGQLRNSGKEMAGNAVQNGQYVPMTLTQANYSAYQVQGAK